MKYDKSPIKLRRRKMPSGNTSLYLDIYSEGRRVYEYLKLYLVPEKTKADKLNNRQTLEFAQAVLAKRIVELRNGEYGFKQAKAKAVQFFPYYEAECVKRYGTKDPSKWRVWGALYKIIRNYEKREGVRLADITPQWVGRLRGYMDGLTARSTSGRGQHKKQPISTRTKQSYISKLSTLLNKAVREGLMERNPVASVDRYQVDESKREYLTKDEVQTLSRTECRRPDVKAAFLFSCLTGLRFSDVTALTWADVHQQGEFTRLVFRQKKTKGQEYLDISPQAVRLMGDSGQPSDRVFSALPTLANVNIILGNWVATAGITKHITFHCARHTFATLMLDIGTDLYTVSKLLGHREIGTTQIYAKIMDKAKQAAVANIPDLIE